MSGGDSSVGGSNFDAADAFQKFDQYLNENEPKTTGEKVSYFFFGKKRLVIDDGKLECRQLWFYEKLLANFGYGPAAFKGIAKFYERNKELLSEAARAQNKTQVLTDIKGKFEAYLKKTHFIASKHFDFEEPGKATSQPVAKIVTKPQPMPEAEEQVGVATGSGEMPPQSERTTMAAQAVSSKDVPVERVDLLRENLKVYQKICSQKTFSGSGDAIAIWIDKNGKFFSEPSENAQGVNVSSKRGRSARGHELPFPQCKDFALKTSANLSDLNPKQWQSFLDVLFAISKTVPQEDRNSRVNGWMSGQAEIPTSMTTEVFNLTSAQKETPESIYLRDSDSLTAPFITIGATLLTLLKGGAEKAELVDGAGNLKSDAVIPVVKDRQEGLVIYIPKSLATERAEFYQNLQRLMSELSYAKIEKKDSEVEIRDESIETSYKCTIPPEKVQDFLENVLKLGKDPQNKGNRSVFAELLKIDGSKIAARLKETA